MRGIGKTTLAQLLFNTHSVEDHFDPRMWVCVSDNFDVKRISRQIIESATKEESISNSASMDLVQSRLQSLLNGKRYLLVLDDVWSEDDEKWDELKTLLSGGAKGSKILVTTRSEKVAWIMGTLPPLKLKGLSEDHCWMLFRERAFRVSGADENPNLVAYRKEIAKKCRGVPLAAKTLGSLMCFKRSEGEWLSIMESDTWNSPYGFDHK
ncbi:disease resistance protein RGA2-like [Tasmannia lanceolata]|uniref:disease resistance protein RGA2-like n=1 Tax=Tasmannia lanceolata TaxID=3420 RepID=UPI0040628D1A